ncbi:MAG: aryl-sulfate sulfohydrolase, partial [Rubripirellula sp.]
VVSWPGKIPGGQIYEHPISALDVAATAASLAGIESEPGDFDGVDLLPYLSGENKSAPHEYLTWRWAGQSAIREGNWKFLKGGDREYLYDLDADIEEKHSLLSQHPEVASRLRSKLAEWSTQLDPPGLDSAALSKAASDYFDFYLDGKPPTRTRTEAVTQEKQSDRSRKERRRPKQKPETEPTE